VVTGYGQFCPVAKAMELLDERWTMLVLRELMTGSTRYNEIRRGVPKMSPALLSKRLRSLERAGLLIHEGEGREGRYLLTESGAELFPVVQAIGLWGLRWVPELGEADLDPHLLMWDMSRTVPVERWPSGRTVVEFHFDDIDPTMRSWWFVVADGGVDVCDADPGHEISATVSTQLRTLVRIWRGDMSWTDALRGEAVSVTAPPRVVRAVPSWFGRATLADAAAAAGSRLRA
jgi:DNA-binding HxlR family transcriptional regulator